MKYESGVVETARSAGGGEASRRAEAEDRGMGREGVDVMVGGRAPSPAQGQRPVPCRAAEGMSATGGPYVPLSRRSAGQVAQGERTGALERRVPRPTSLRESHGRDFRPLHGGESLAVLPGREAAAATAAEAMAVAAAVGRARLARAQARVIAPCASGCRTQRHGACRPPCRRRPSARRRSPCRR